MSNKRHFLLIAMILLAASSLWSWRYVKKRDASAIIRSFSKPMTMCGGVTQDWDDVDLPSPELLPGLGNIHFAISTKSSAAQAFFDQGLRLVYAFNHWEAMRAFRETIRLDPGHPMGYWGLALALGPNLNDWNPTDRERIAFEAIRDALSRSAHGNTTEQDVIHALAARYNGRSYEVRDSLNNAYGSVMEKLASKYPGHADIQALAADAIMNTMPWNYWKADGEAKPATGKAKLMLETAMKKFPDHAGLHHLYIHLVEASLTPEIGLNSARVLETAMPAAGHIVHMPAHIYIRTGMYDKSITSNILAAQVDERYLSYSENQGMYRAMYYPHNVDFVAYSAYMEGRSDLGIQTALKLAYKGNFIKSSAPAFSQYLGVEPMIAYVRFGKWADILALPNPGYEIMYAQIIWRFSRGLAFTRTGYIQQAKAELGKLDSLNSLDTLRKSYLSFNPVSTTSDIALHLLRGEINAKEQQWDEAIKSLQQAVSLQDSMVYNEPPDWKIPTRHYLGAVLLEAGQFEDAEKVYSKDLQSNRENGWSLTGLLQSCSKQNKKAEAAAAAKRLTKAWKNADVKLMSSRF